MGAFTCHDPSEMYLWALVLLVIALALCLLAVAECLISHHTGWAWYFGAMSAGCIVMYLRVVVWWVQYMRRTGG
jgi:hypothetical protein